MSRGLRTAAGSAVVHATRTDASDPWIIKLAAEVRANLGIVSERPGLPRISVSGGAIGMLIMNLDEAAIVRIPFESEGAARVRSNIAGLGRAQDLIAGGLDCVAPEPLGMSELDGVPYGVESFIVGDVVQPSLNRQTNETYERAFQLLLELQGISNRGCDATGHWADMVVKMIDGTESWAETKQQQSMVRDIAAFARDSDPGWCPLVACHGDYKVGNIMIERSSGRLVLLDWELFCDADFAAIDYAHLVISRRVSSGGGSPFAALARWAAGQDEDEVERRWSEHFEDASGLQSGWRRLAALSYWARDSSMRLGTRRELDCAWIGRHFLDNLPLLHSLTRRSCA